jgi:cytochrome d ubiquinol oxidase subunit II
MIDLPLIWAGLIAFAALAYVLLDGFDLGIGILFPFLKNREERQLAMNTIAPVWDGNQTWLVLGGGGLFAVFPLAYAIVMPALYPLIIAMLLGLIFRGVAFEFVHRTRRMRGFWEFGFWGGSLTAAIAQGMALGTLVRGVAVEGRAYAGGIGAGGGICLAGRDLAHLQDGRRDAGACAPLRPTPGVGAAGADRRSESRHPVPAT